MITLILKNLLKPDHLGARPFRPAKKWPLPVVSSTESSIKALNKASCVSFLNKPKPLVHSLGLQHTRLHSCLGCGDQNESSPKGPKGCLMPKSGPFSCGKSVPKVCPSWFIHTGERKLETAVWSRVSASCYQLSLTTGHSDQRLKSTQRPVFLRALAYRF